MSFRTSLIAASALALIVAACATMPA
ncbi:MAG: hypothetical protein RIR33_368, partial [Pseudomonadota bacterium]